MIFVPYLSYQNWFRESLLNRDSPLPWTDVMRNLLPETQAYIEAAKSRRGK